MSVVWFDKEWWYNREWYCRYGYDKNLFDKDWIHSNTQTKSNPDWFTKEQLW